MTIDFEPFILSIQLAALVTALLLVVGIPFAWYLSQMKSGVKPFLEAITTLPIVLPPSVLGFYLLVLLSKNSPIGAFFEDTLGISLVFNFTSLVIASVIYSFPFMIQPLQGGFEKIDKSLLEASYIAGKSKLHTLLFIVLPNIKPSLLVAIVITFAHTMGEFGVVLMVGGSIPSETKVASVAIYELVEVMDYEAAHVYSAIMVAISVVILSVVYLINHKMRIIK